LKLLGYVQITLIPAGQLFLLAGLEEKFGHEAVSALGDKAELPIGYQQKHGNSHPCSLERRVG
jgi:hypothetical protein